MIHKIICQNQRSLGKLAKVDMFQQVPSPRFVHFGKDYLACMVLCFTQFQVKIVWPRTDKYYQLSKYYFKRWREFNAYMVHI